MVATRRSVRRAKDESDKPPSPQPPAKRAKREPTSTSELPKTESSGAARLPLEVVANVMKHLRDGGQGTLASFMTTSKQMYDLAAPLLYEHVVVTRVNADRLFMGIPRTKVPKGRKQTKAEFDADVPVVERKFGDKLTDTELWGHNEDDFPSPRADSDIETDDECAPHIKTAKGYPNEQSQKRKVALLAMVKRVHLVQVPPMALVEDLCTLVGATEYDSDSAGDGDDDERDAPVIYALSEWDNRHFDETHPLVESFKQFVPAAVHVCVTCPPGDENFSAARVCRWTSTRAADLTDSNIETLVDEIGCRHCCTRHGRPSCFENVLPAKLASLTVHGMRYPGVRHRDTLRGMVPRPFAGYGLPLAPAPEVPRTYRYFYDESPILPGDSDECCKRHDTVQRRAQAVASNLESTAPASADAVEVFEHVNVGRNVYTALNGALISEVEAEAAVRARVEEMIAKNPDDYRFKSRVHTRGWGTPKIGTGYAPEDRDEGKDAAATTADDEARRLYKDVDATSAEARRLQREAELARSEVNRFDPKRAKPQRVERKRVQPQRVILTSPELEAAHQVIKDLSQASRNLQAEVDDANAAYNAARGTAGEAAAAAAFEAKKEEEDEMREKRREADKTYGRIRNALANSPAALSQKAEAKQAEAAAQMSAAGKAEAAATSATPDQAQVAAKKAATERAEAAKKAAAAAKAAEEAAREIYNEARKRSDRLREEADQFANERRIAKLKESAPLPEARLKYLTADEADPCIVCGLGHVDGQDWSLAAVIQRAFEA